MTPPIVVSSIPGTPAVPATASTKTVSGRGVISIDPCGNTLYYLVTEVGSTMDGLTRTVYALDEKHNEAIRLIVASSLSFDEKWRALFQLSSSKEGYKTWFAKLKLELAEHTQVTTGTEAVPAGESRIRIELSQEQFLRLRTVFNFTPVVEAIGAREWASELRADNTFIHLMSDAARYTYSRIYTPFVDKLIASIRR